MTLLIFYLLLALCVSAFCSVAEAVLLSVRPSYVAALEAKEHPRAALLGKLTSNLDRPLAAILTANTIAHTVGAAGVGAQAAYVFGDEYLGLVSAVLTFLILVASEIIPKTLGATYWQPLAPFMAILINGMTRLLLPLVWLSEKLTRLISSSGHSPSTISRAELKAMAAMGAETGVLEQKELRIVNNLLKLRNLSVRAIMTPRPVVFTLSSELTVEEYFGQYTSQPFSRIPLFDENRDDLNSYVLKDDLLLAQAKDQFGTLIGEFRRNCPMILDNMSASDTFDRLMHEKSHFALVVDEYGTVQGLVTLEDVMETLIGLEITDEMDRVEDMQKLAHLRWRDRMAAMGIDPDSLDDKKS